MLRDQRAMQLTVRDVSKFLKVSESTVTRWIKQRGLPSQHVGGQYRFNRVELLEWATANKIRVSLEAFDDLRAEDEPVPSLVEALEAGGIFYKIKNSNKDTCLARLGRGPAASGGRSIASCSCGSSWPGRLRRARRSATASRFRTFATRLSCMSCGRWSRSASSSIPSTSGHSMASPCTCSSRSSARPCGAICRCFRGCRTPCRTRSSRRS